MGGATTMDLGGTQGRKDGVMEAGEASTNAKERMNTLLRTEVKGNCWQLSLELPICHRWVAHYIPATMNVFRHFLYICAIFKSIGIEAGW
jgi:hypothetical protein